MFFMKGIFGILYIGVLDMFIYLLLMYLIIRCCIVIKRKYNIGDSMWF